MGAEDDILRAAHLVQNAPRETQPPRLLFSAAGPEKEPGVPGEWVDLSAMVTDVRLEQRADPFRDVIADLVRRYDPGGYLLRCPLAGCGWELLVPRMELDPTVLDVDRDGSGYLVSVQGVPREDVEQALGSHIDWHAMATETVTG